MYGSVGDMEPPDPEFYCALCARREEDKAVERRLILGCWWLKPTWCGGADTYRRGDDWMVRLRHPKGGDPAEWPEDLCVREWPQSLAEAQTNAS